jgi:pantoate--beta-alanine ligase
MQTFTSIAELRRQIAEWRRQDLRIAFVPTMGNLHAGHLHLVHEARRQADKVVASIFVNPTQFGPGEDFERYPRTEQQDRAMLSDAGCDALFLPAVQEIYPQGAATQITVGNLNNILCGAHRPGHFDGVALVVCKLLNMVQPDRLLLGEKDFQQLAVIRQMVADLNIPVQICGVPTVRDADGLALSSRNGYLTVRQRQLAPLLYQVLRDVQEAVIGGRGDYRQLSEQQQSRLNEAGFAVDYVQICRQNDLQAAEVGDHELVILVAARLGATRLIDNLAFRKP